MALESIAEKINANLDGQSFEGSLKFDCAPDGVIVLADGAASLTDRKTDCTLLISQDNLVKLLTGNLNPMMAIMTGKVKISGDAGVAMKLAKLLG